jgi:hypothetical protein
MTLEMKYFVLNPKAKARDDLLATASQEAMIRYAEVIEPINAELAEDLAIWARREMVNQERLCD